MNKRLALVTSLITLSSLAPIGIHSAFADPPSGLSTSGSSEKTSQYQVTGLSTRADRSAVARTGAAVDFVEHGTLYVTATASEVDRIERLGFQATRVPKLTRTLEADAAVTGFPTADSNYHDYAETNAELRRIAAAYPQLAQVSVIGRSYEGRDILAIKISDNVTTDEAEPEILLNGNIHAREHLTTEQALYVANMLTTGYSAETRVRGAVDSREWWIIPMLNPDGSEYDHAAGSYRSWRKNRQPNAGTTAVGTDLNRNFGYRWGCCNGSSTSPSSDTYRGPSAFSAPESQVLRDFTLSRRVGGVQQIKAHIDIHSYGKLILWPYGYTYADTDTGLSPDQASTFATIGREMAATNGYTPQQASELYVTDGTTSDWMWGNQGIWSYTFELYPDSSSPGFYPPDEVIPAETARNKDAMLMLAEYADCPYRAIGKQQQYCGQTSNDFSIGVTPGTGSTAPGGSTTATVSTTTVSGPAQQVTLSATGLPTGATATFSPTTVTSGASSTMTIQTATSTPAGTYQVSIKGTGSDGTVKSATFSLTVGTAGSCSTLETTRSGSLATGASVYQPDGTYFTTTVSGAHKGCLDGPTGTDFDLYLQKWNGSSWSTVASGTSAAPDETINYSGTAGRYRYRVHAYSGSGPYTLGFDAP
ncbi:M14 family metallopeptidase [Nocardioides sp.]|uniref:M14 family metallopeptidase n=1 Tax=Nocardioides sp. TaxID=35761 RepID=UPI002CCBD7AB|nr:M14 family metallopeptidase [Nocardioides sp.]HXH77181.1 M14 family metallopeptidase [Nocardioides sp.]